MRRMKQPEFMVLCKKCGTMLPGIKVWIKERPVMHRTQLPPEAGDAILNMCEHGVNFPCNERGAEG